MNLTTHFTLEEMTFSETASRLGLPNQPSAYQVESITRVCQTLEQVRSLFSSPIFIHSGFRSPDVNIKVGGVPTSAHCKGLAADFTVNNFRNYDAALRIRDSGILFDQLILEYGWIHIGLCEPNLIPRKECLTKRSASAQWETGINP